MVDDTVKVLIVDDEWIIRQQLRRALSTVGFDCECATDGSDAWERFAERKHELVVTDLRMPIGNGHSLAVSLLNQPNRPKVVVLTGVTEPRIVNDLLARGIDDIIFKPVDYFELADGLKRMLHPPLPQALGSAMQPCTSSPAQTLVASSNSTVESTVDLATLERHFLQSHPKNPWLAAAIGWIDWEALPKPPDDVYRFIRETSSRSSNVQIDQKSEPGITFRKLVVAAPLDMHCNPIGRPFRLRAQGLSRHEITLVHNAALDAPNLCLAWKASAKTVILFARLLHCQPISRYFTIRAAFLPERPSN